MFKTLSLKLPKIIFSLLQRGDERGLWTVLLSVSEKPGKGARLRPQSAALLAAGSGAGRAADCVLPNPRARLFQ
jgi:hypothetical protein